MEFGSPKCMLSLFLSFLACKPKPVATQSNTAPRLAESLGTTEFRKIYRGDSISLYRLGAPNSGDVQIAGQAVLEGPIVLKDKDFASIRSFLLNDEHFIFDANVRCRLRPTHALLIWMNGKEIQVLFSNRGKCPNIGFQSQAGKKILSLSKDGQKNL